MQLERPVIQLIKHRNGRMNYEEVLRLGKGAPGGKSPLVDFHNVRLNGGTLRIALPWNPDRSLRTQASKDSALRAERAKPGRTIEESPEGLRRVILLSDLTTRLSRLRIATPDRKPFTIDLDSLATRINDPAVTLRDAAGRVVLRGDSAIFSLARGALPDTRFSGGGAVTWPRDTILYDFQVISPHVNLEDLRWVSPDFPSMTGSGVLTARSVSGTRTEYDIRELRLRAGPQQVSGELVAITDRRRGLGVRDMRLQLRDLDLDAVRPYLDTLPFFGTLTGKRVRLGLPGRARRAARLGVRRRAGAGQPGDHHRRRRRRRRAARRGAGLHRLRGAELGRGPPHRPPHRSRGDPGGASRRQRHARWPASQRHLPGHRAASRRRPAGRAWPSGWSISTPGSTPSASPPTWRWSRSPSMGSGAPSRR